MLAEANAAAAPPPQQATVRVENEDEEPMRIVKGYQRPTARSPSFSHLALQNSNQTTPRPCLWTMKGQPGTAGDALFPNSAVEHSSATVMSKQNGHKRGMQARGGR